MATTLVAKMSDTRLKPLCDSSLKVSGSPTAIVVVGRPPYRICSLTRDWSWFSAGRYSMGVGAPELSAMEEDQLYMEKISFWRIIFLLV